MIGKNKAKRVNKKGMHFISFFKRPPELFNILTGISGLLLFFASNKIHGNFASILTWLSGLLFTIGIHFEIILRIRFKFRQFIVPIIFVSLLVVYLFQTFGTSNINILGNHHPYVNYKIDKLDLDSVGGKLMLQLRLVNNSENLPAINLFKCTTLVLDSVSASDSIWAIDVLKRHKDDEGTLVPRELRVFPIKLGIIAGTVKNPPMGSYIGGVREYFKYIDIYILGAYSYRDNANNRYLCMYCISYDPWSDHQNLYIKYNHNVLVDW